MPLCKALPKFALLGLAGLLAGALVTPPAAAGDFVPLPKDELIREEDELVDLIKMAELRHQDLGAEALFRMLNVARSYHALFRLDQAASWYEILAEKDVEGLFDEVRFNSLLALSIDRGDWDRAETLIFSDDAPPLDGEAEALLRLAAAMGRAGRWPEVLGLADRVASAQEGPTTAPVLLLRAWSLRRLGRVEEASFLYETVLNDSRIPESVHPSVVEKRGEFLRGAGDCAFLLNERLQARRYFSMLMESDEHELRAWGRYRMAQLDMLENGYEAAAAGFAEVAADSVGATLQSWARQMQTHAESMIPYADWLPDHRPSNVVATP